jgi:hypothetical protein
MCQEISLLASRQFVQEFYRKFQPPVTFIFLKNVVPYVGIVIRRKVKEDGWIVV